MPVHLKDLPREWHPFVTNIAGDVAERSARPKPKRAMRAPKTQMLLWQLHAAKLPKPETEYRFHQTRRWAFDLAWPTLKFAVEIEGVVYPTKGSGEAHLTGRHVSAKGFTADIEKYGEACAMGWRILRVLPKHVSSGTALSWIESVLDGQNSGKISGAQQ